VGWTVEPVDFEDEDMGLEAKAFIFWRRRK
jgi:hypothetical protein